MKRIGCGSDKLASQLATLRRSAGMVHSSQLGPPIRTSFKNISQNKDIDGLTVVNPGESRFVSPPGGHIAPDNTPDNGCLLDMF